MFTVPEVVKLPLTWSVLPSFTWNVPLLVVGALMMESVPPKTLARTVPWLLKIRQAGDGALPLDGALVH